MIHLIKLSVGPESLAELKSWQAKRLKALKAAGKKPFLMHVTRHKPKREEELLDGGSIYWVIKGRIVARQKLLELRTVTRNDIKCCGLVYDKRMVAVHTHPHRAFQGWRYLKAADAPRDLTEREIDENLPEDVRQELAMFGVL